MKKAVTFDEIMASVICAMGYGFGFAVPSAYDINPIVCLAISMVLGTILGIVANKIIFSSSVQKSKKKRYTVFACVGLLFLAGYSFLATYFAHSLWQDVGSQMLFTIGIPVVAFVGSIRSLYVSVSQSMVGV